MNMKALKVSLPVELVQHVVPSSLRLICVLLVQQVEKLVPISVPCVSVMVVAVHP